METLKPRRVAIVGTGAAGLATLWALRQSPKKYDIYLFEADDRLGGHVYTVPFPSLDGRVSTMVDTAFIVCNEATYPNFLAFLEHIGITPVPTEMSFSVSRDYGMFEWASMSLRSIFAQAKNLHSFKMWRMLFDIVRFNYFALDVLGNSGQESGESLSEFLERERYGTGFKENYIIPMTAAAWSTSPDKCALQFPVVTLVRWNHGLLNLFKRPQWFTIGGGSYQYVDKILEGFPQDRIYQGWKVRSVESLENGGRLVLRAETSLDGLGQGFKEEFDHVVLATHGDQALEILGEKATEAEIDILGNFSNSKNIAVLHRDEKFMPRLRDTWAAWNYIAVNESRKKQRTQISLTLTPNVSLTYNMNILQHLCFKKYGPVLVTLNPLQEPDPRKVVKKFLYEHPLYTFGVIKAQDKLGSIQNKRGISFCGAWTGYGFHEDAFSSGLRVAIEHLGAAIPFEWVDAKYLRGKNAGESKTVGETSVRWLIWWIQLWVVVIAFVFNGGGNKVKPE